MDERRAFWKFGLEAEGARELTDEEYLEARGWNRTGEDRYGDPESVGVYRAFPKGEALRIQLDRDAAVLAFVLRRRFSGEPG